MKLTLLDDLTFKLHLISVDLWFFVLLLIVGTVNFELISGALGLNSVFFRLLYSVPNFDRISFRGEVYLEFYLKLFSSVISIKFIIRFTSNKF